MKRMSRFSYRFMRHVAASCSVLLLALLLPPSCAPAAATVQPARHPYAAPVAEAAQRFGIPELWIWRVMHAESRGKIGAVSHAGAMGLMQIMPGTWASLTARHRLGADPFDPRANILAGAAYLRAMWDRYGDVRLMLAAYNAGPGRVDAYASGRRGLPAETIAYVAKIAPILGTSGIASPAVVPAAPRAPAAPSWRDAALFVLRGDGGWDGSEIAVDPAPVAQPGGIPTAPAPSPSGLPPRSSLPGSHGLFVPLSGRSEQ